MNLLDTPDFFLNKEQRSEKKQLEAAVKFKERFVSFVLFSMSFFFLLLLLNFPFSSPSPPPRSFN